MNKKIVIGCIGIVFMLVAITMVSAVNSNKSLERRESPLFKLRTNKAINERIQELKTNFFRNRMFYILPITFEDSSSSIRQNIMASKGSMCTVSGMPTGCDRPNCFTQSIYSCPK